MRSRDAGQATADYAALLLVVVVALAAAGAVAVPGIGERVVAAVRTGLCLVGGDICRDADARAAGLLPCVTSERTSGRETALDIAVLRVGEEGRWTVALRSDGSVLVSRAEGRALGRTVAVGLPLGQSGVELGLDGHLEAIRRSGRSWRFPNLPAARRFLDEALGSDPGAIERFPPDERWEAGGAGGEATAGATVPFVGSAGGRVAVEGVLGRRTGGGRTTWFFRGTIDDPQLFATLPAWSSSGPGREALLELTSDAGGPRELVVRGARSRPDRREEITARLDLRDPEVRTLIGGRAPWTPGVLRELLPMAVRRGIVEREVHVIDDRSRTFASEARVLAVALGVEHTRVDVRSRLADASVWIAGSGPRRREDCLGA